MLRNVFRTGITANKIVNCLSHYKSINSRLYCELSSLYNGNSNRMKVYKPRRACMYIPGDDERKLAKLSQIKADCIILDCEDGVAANKKVEARKNIASLLSKLDDDSFNKHDIAVRVNCVDSGMAADDMEYVLEASRLPNTILLPKVESVDHIDWLASQMSSHIKDGFLNLIIYVESALGLINLLLICTRSMELTDMGAPFRLTSVIFGSDDFIADIGATRSKDSSELLYARQSLVTVAKAFKLQAIDLVDIDYKDNEGLKTRSEQSFKMGFTGKQVIHPNQVNIVQKAYTPTDESIEWARALIHEFQLSQEQGKGAFNFRGLMIDAPLVLQAKNILRIVDDVETKN